MKRLVLILLAYTGYSHTNKPNQPHKKTYFYFGHNPLDIITEKEIVIGRYPKKIQIKKRLEFGQKLTVAHGEKLFIEQKGYLRTGQKKEAIIFDPKKEHLLWDHVPSLQTLCALKLQSQKGLKEKMHTLLTGRAFRYNGETYHEKIEFTDTKLTLHTHTKK